METGNSK